MKKLILIRTILFFIILSGIFIYFQWFQKPLHKSISRNDIESIQIYGINTAITLVDDAVLIDKLIKWFNNSSDIRPNKNFEGTTPESGIIINLKSGKRILILRSGKNFEVQRNDVRPKNISYWAKQQDIKDYLDKLATNTKKLLR